MTVSTEGGRGERRRTTRLLRASMVPRLKALIGLHPANVVIFSPYLTSEVAEEIASLCEASTCRICTNFETELFVTGASDIRTLRKLRELGCALLHLPRLHAKIYLGETFVLVGSQNLTRRGHLGNREASALVQDRETVADFRTRLEAWLALATPISDEAIDRMERFVAEMRPRFDAAKAGWGDHDKAMQGLLRRSLPVVFARAAATSSLWGQGRGDPHDADPRRMG